MSARAFGIASLGLFAIGLWALIYVDDTFVRFIVVVATIQASWVCEIQRLLMLGLLRKGEA